jgi:hypothetical protein
MNKLKLTGFFSILMAIAFFIASCKKGVDSKFFYIVNAPLSASQTIPASLSTAGGAIDGTYDNKTKILSYTVSYTNLLDTATSLAVRGLADSGAIAVSPGTVQTFTFTKTSTPANYLKSGVFSGQLFFDGVLLKEEDLLAGKYYIELRSKAKPAGELRGQLRFNQ